MSSALILMFAGPAPGLDYSANTGEETESYEQRNSHPQNALFDRPGSLPLELV